MYILLLLATVALGADATSPASCTACHKVARTYQDIVKYGNSSAQASIDLGREMCRVFDFGGSAQLQLCDAIVNATLSLKNANFRHMSVGDICHKAGFCSGASSYVVVAAKDGACCQGACQKPGEEKYWSIAKSLFGKPHCGECCMNPKHYKLYKFFEKNLTKSDQGSPCRAFGYPVYDSTVTHGVWPVKMTLDLYNLPAKQ